MRLISLIFLIFAYAFGQSPMKVDGIWLGALEGGGQKLRIQLHVQSDAAGKVTVSLDSLDQGAAGIPCENAKLAGDQFSFDVPVVKGSWTGILSADGKELKGIWTQGGGSTALGMTRQSSATALSKPTPKYDAKAPVTLDQLKQILDADLAVELKSGSLSPETSGGVVIGVIQHGKRKILTYGPVNGDSIFEIGSISKTFTGLILAQMVAQKQVAFDQPLRDFLPPGTVTKPAGAEITLLDLATQHSGLPRLPDNLALANTTDPYADYSPQKLYEFLKKQGVGKPEHTEFLYSNLGVGTLGQALVNKAGIGYPELLKKEVTGPLGMNDTAVKLSTEQEKRFAPGHNGANKVVSGWAFDALAGAGGIRSTAADMLTYLEAQLHPSETIEAAIKATHELRDDALPGMKIGLAWLFIPKINSYWHNGATGGYSSYALFSPTEDYGVIVLYNHTITNTGSFADRLGEHVAERLSGRPALVLE